MEEFAHGSLRLLAAASLGLLAACPAALPPASPVAPTAPTIALNPADPSTVDDLTVTIVSPSTDPDGDFAGYVIRWQRDGVDVPEAAGDTAPASLTARDETWGVWVRAEDAGGLTSPAAFAEVVVANTVPTPPTVAVQPAEPTPDDALVCVVAGEGRDADEDPLTYTFAWTVDGADFEGAETTTWDGDTVPGSGTEPLQVWRCSVAASDGTAASAAVFATATIGEVDTRVPDFALPDVNPTSLTSGLEVSPRDYLQKVSGWYFGHAT